MFFKDLIKNEVKFREDHEMWHMCAKFQLNWRILCFSTIQNFWNFYMKLKLEFWDFQIYFSFFTSCKGCRESRSKRFGLFSFFKLEQTEIKFRVPRAARGFMLPPLSPGGHSDSCSFELIGKIAFEALLPHGKTEYRKLPATTIPNFAWRIQLSSCFDHFSCEICPNSN